MSLPTSVHVCAMNLDQTRARIKVVLGKLMVSARSGKPIWEFPCSVCDKFIEFEGEVVDKRINNERRAQQTAVAARRPQYRLIASLLRKTTAELLLKGVDEHGISLPGTERRRKRLIDRVLVVVERLNEHERRRAQAATRV